MQYRRVQIIVQRYTTHAAGVPNSDVTGSLGSYFMSGHVLVLGSRATPRPCSLQLFVGLEVYRCA